MRDPFFAARLGSVTQLVFAVILGALPLAIGDPVPEFIPRGVVVMVVFALPGVVGLLGIRARRPTLLLAAGAVSAAGSVVSFSGVTLIFLVPALLLLAGAGQVAGGGRPRGWTGLVREALVGVAVVALLIGAGVAALFITDEKCWTAYETPVGTVFQTTPFDPTREQEVSTVGSSAGCASGLVSAPGVGLAALLATAAVGLVVLSDPERARRGGPSMIT